MTHWDWYAIKENKRNGSRGNNQFFFLEWVCMKSGFYYSVRLSKGFQNSSKVRGKEKNEIGKIIINHKILFFSPHLFFFSLSMCYQCHWICAAVHAAGCWSVHTKRKINNFLWLTKTPHKNRIIKTTKRPFDKIMELMEMKSYL